MHRFPHLNGRRSATTGRATLAAAALTLAALAGTAAQAQTAEVSFQSPETFSEFAGPGAELDEARRTWMPQLQRHLEREAARTLPAGQKLVVTITDVRLAGRVDPFFAPGNPPVRVLRGADAPRIDLRYTLVDAGGAVLATGEDKLRNLGYLGTLPPQLRNEPLAYERALLSDWLSGIKAQG